nr:retrotransposon protein, putative, Ty1-copia subclass [Tanacetum cinerariifolium]
MSGVFAGGSGCLGLMDEMVHPIQNINHSAFMSMFKSEKLSGNNFNDWFRHLKLVLRVEKKMYVIEQPLPVAPTVDYVANINERLGYMLPQDLIIGLILNGFTKDFAGFVRNYNMHNMGKTIGELHAMLIEYEKGLPKKDETPQAMMIKGGKIQSVDKKSLKAKGKGKANVSKNNVFYFNAIPSNGIYEIDMHDLVPNDNSIYNVSNKRTKHNLDSTYLWHCCLAYISNKRIKKLQQEGCLRSIDDESSDQCVSCLSGKMTRKSFLRHLERVTDLLGIIHTDVCGPLRHISRQGASSFITFTNDYSRYGYVYLLKHKHEHLITQEVSGRSVDLKKIQDEDASPFEITSEIPMEVEVFKPPQEEVILIRRSVRTHQAPDCFCLNVKVLVDLPPNCKTIESKWIFKKKTDMDAAFYDYEIWKMDVKHAFLNCYLDEDIYIVQPEGFVDPNHPRKFTKCKDYLRKCFAIKDLEEAASILRIKIYRDRSKRLIRLGQNAYMDKILKKYKMDNCKRGHIPMQVRLNLNKTQGASTSKEVKKMEAVWIRKFISRLGIVPTINEPIKMFRDNSAALLIASEPWVQKGTKHYHRSNLIKVYTGDNLAYPFTKALQKGKFTQHAKSMGLRLASSFI